jgi:hypothetical protein
VSRNRLSFLRKSVAWLLPTLEQDCFRPRHYLRGPVSAAAPATNALLPMTLLA